MSVINKMLRDLDTSGQRSASHAELAGGTASVRVPENLHGGKASPVAAWMMMLALLLVLCLAGAWWWSTGRAQDAPKPSQVAGAPLVLTGEAVPAMTAEALMKPLADVPVALPASAAAPSRPVPAVVMPLQTVPAKPAGALPVVATPPTSLTSVPSPAVAVTVVAERNTALPMTAVSAPVRVPVALEVIAHAQSVWNGGSRDVAIALMRDAVAAAERALGTSDQNVSSLVPLVRELARMELAHGQPAEVAALLSRLEPWLLGQADLWAVRANAAQRLVRHAESSNAYLMALKLRPDEPRWMLGAAVSLAVQGQTAAAAEWAERARLKGAVSLEVGAYLRELGVTLKD